MRRFLLNAILLFSLSLVLVNCANRGTPSGGDKDTTPPVITKTEPENYTTNFTGNEIRIYFDEYIKVKDLQKHLIISPPMDPEPEITPLGTAGKYITIKIYDTLQPNTTYAFNFGESIVDNNEENPYPYYRYVFSTGDYIDSLSVKGSISDALNRKADEFVSILMYEVDSSFNDSVIYKKKPKYISNTLDSLTTFTVENMKAGKYLMIALKEENSNYTFQQKSDKIGFVKHHITIPTDSVYSMKMFKEHVNFKAARPRLVSGNKIAFGYEGSHEEMKIKLLSEVPDDFVATIIKDPKSDTLNYWYKPDLTVDSLLFEVSGKRTIDTFSVKIKENRKDSLLISATPSRAISFTEDLEVEATIPFMAMDESKITLIDKDSANVDYTVTMDSLKNTYRFQFDKTEDNTYNMQMLPGTFTDFFGAQNDTLNYTLRTKAYSDYGNMRLTIVNATYPLIVQLVNSQGEVKVETYVTANEPIDMRHIPPGKYFLRVVFDTNGNREYDPGNFLKKMQPERVSYYPEELDIRSGWDYIETFTLQQ